jgi:succinate dehydrogenase / fumarate reductase cytochrome b subunit
MRENFWLHKLHSLSGVIPVGFYMLQHLTLNSFSLAGPEKFNGVIEFFENWPPHLLLAAELLIILGPILFHAVYGLFIVSRMEPYTSPAAAKYRENKYYSLQRWSGVVAFFFLCVHVASTAIRHKVQGVDVVKYQAMAEMLQWPNNLHLGLIFYVVGVVACAYHLAYGIWNFCIRWGITIAEKSQLAMTRVAFVLFVVISLLGVGSLAGFLKPQKAQAVQVLQNGPSGKGNEVVYRPN